ncbi:TetR/AcrR family transcriptional regulator [Fodinicola acaciae]|uniref:TetR/AcrR family transcriptional regulator n=1 Tax=Fodinicola acaciae TaxID=2681555 RepID=UPI0013D4983E|nr:TetR/AcrR family transcriptional regulator [Fodinicola acaciae]
MSNRARPLRRDAVENRRKLIDAAEAVFASRGLDVPLEEIAKRAGVSIGTLYNNFATREALLDEVMPAKVLALRELAESALSCADPWRGFVAYVMGACERQAADRGLNDILSRRYPDAQVASRACASGFAQVGDIIERAHRSGQLRADFTLIDFAYIIWSAARIIDATRDAAPDSWRRHVHFLLDGLQASAATAVEQPPMTSEQLVRAMGAPGPG